MEAPRVAPAADAPAAPRRYRPRRLRAAVIAGVSLGLGGAALGLSPWGQALEQDLGLAALFTLRGPTPPPSEVVIVAIDRDSAARLNLPNEPRRWQRTLHADLVDRLAAAGAAVIVFDMFFGEARDPAVDARFGAALRRAGNVALFAYLKKETVPLPGGAEAVVERIVPPVAPLARSAGALAPFPLPKVPVRVNQFWTYKTSAGEAATLPVCALHLYTMPFQTELGAAATHAGAPPVPQVAAARDIGPLAQQLRATFGRDTAALGAMRTALAATADERGRRLTALLDTITGPEQRYLNYYGPARTLTTISYHTALTQPLPSLKGKAVFVGFAERYQPEQKDYFYTVYSQPDGVDLSGVEILATAFANLLHGTDVRPLSLGWRAGVLAVWGLAIGFMATALGTRATLGASVLAIGALLALAQTQFALYARWFPLIVPLLLQWPAALMTGILVRHAEARRERRVIRRAFGYYLPDDAVDRLARGGAVDQLGRLVYGVCITSDVERYTSVAEHLTPAALRTLMNRYYEVVFTPVRRHGGIVSDVVGDAMVALWVSPRPDPALRQRACRAAIEILEGLERFNATTTPPLPTRIGIHAGEVMLGNVGAMDHYEYRAVGDMVNTAARLQALGRTLGIPLIVSAETLVDLPGFHTRPLGRFVLRGKTVPVAVHQLCATAHAAETLHRQFADALELFYNRRFAPAAEAFQALWDEHRDPPCAFYGELARRCLAGGDALRDGAVYLRDPPHA